MKKCRLMVLAVIISGCGASVATDPHGAIDIEAQSVRGWRVEEGHISESMEIPAPGKVTVLDFWSTSCEPCIAAMPELEDIWQRADWTRVQFIGVSIDKDDALTRETMTTKFPCEVTFTKSEITVSQYQACVNEGKCSKPKDKSGSKYCNWGYGDRGDHPINCVNWEQAEAVCEWLGGRLPTEDEWYAEASNGGDRDWPWGDSPKVSCDYAVWSEGGDGCGKDSTWPVCSKRKGDSVSGLCDMSGNVWEWTSTPYDSNSKVLRGGSWYDGDPDYLRASNRSRNYPSYRDSNGGVRCSRDD